MLIHSITHGDLLNYPGKMATVIATKGCDQACVYCHNKHLLTEEAKYYKEPPFEILNNNPLRSRHIVITGGEPTIQSDLLLFLCLLKHRDFIIKLDTNSCYTPVSTYLHHLSYVALDIKHFNQMYLRTNIVSCVMADVLYELRFTAFGNTELMYVKIKELLEDVRIAQKMRLNSYMEQPAIYLQKCNSHEQGWNDQQIDELQNKLEDLKKKKRYRIHIKRR